MELTLGLKQEYSTLRLYFRVIIVERKTNRGKDRVEPHRCGSERAAAQARHKFQRS